jgi:hypothetical protein
MNGCGVVFVAEFGLTPDQDRLERCTRVDCREHDVQLGWVRDTGLLLRYTEQVRRFEQQRTARVDQGALL